MFQNREVRACIRSIRGALGPAGGPAGGPKSAVFLSSPSGYNSSHQLHQLLDAKDQQAWPRLAPSVDSHSCGGLMVPKEIGDGRTNRRNQSIPSKKLLAGQDSCPVWTKRRDSRSHEMPRSCHTGHSESASPCAVHM